jgi:hypothetical protein
MQGKEMPIAWKRQGDQASLSLKHLPDGFYFLQVSSGPEQAIFKVIKQQ